MIPLAQMFDLAGRSALVTGAAKGIGQAIAFRLAEAGAAVTVADLDLEAAQATVRAIADRRGKAQAVKVNVALPSDAEAAVKAAVDAFGRVDVLVNNAGIFPFAPALDLTEAAWDRVLDVNLKGAFFFAQAAARRMAAGGAIVNIASIDAFKPTGALAHYDASKGGMVMLTKSLALELSKKGLRVNCVAPGGVETPGVAAASGGAVDTAAFAKRIPLGRMGAPDDIALPVLFLCSPAAAYVTGATLIVDGGYLLA